MNYNNFRAVLDYIELKDDGENILKDPVIRLFPSDVQVNWFNFKLPFILVCLYLIFFLSLFHSFIVLIFFIIELECFSTYFQKNYTILRLEDIFRLKQSFSIHFV